MAVTIRTDKLIKKYGQRVVVDHVFCPSRVPSETRKRHEISIYFANGDLIIANDFFVLPIAIPLENGVMEK